MRSNDKAQRLLCITGLSCRPSTNWLLRYRDKQEVHISYKEPCTAGSDNRSPLQVPLEDRNLFHMDQAVPTNQNIFWRHRERGEDTNLDCYHHLCVGGDCQERTQNRVEFGRNLASSQHCTFRESSCQSRTYEKHVAQQESRFS